MFDCGCEIGFDVAPGACKLHQCVCVCVALICTLAWSSLHFEHGTAVAHDVAQTQDLWSPAMLARAHAEAAARGVHPSRLRVLPMLTYDAHIARHGAVDVVLDTRLYAGGTTVAEALWSGVPVVSSRNGGMHSGGASSLLRALGMPELITRSLKARTRPVSQVYFVFLFVFVYAARDCVCD